MATKLFLRETTGSGIGAFRDMLTTAGAGVTTGVVNTAVAGTQIQWTKTAGGAVLEWISGRVPAGGFTLAGTMSFSIWALENNMSANAGARVRVFKRTGAGVETEVLGGPYNDGVEFGTTATEMTWTGAPTSTAFAENDRLIVRYYITNVGVMGGGFTCTISYDSADAATGDSFFQINENVTFKLEDVTGTSALTARAATLAASGSETFSGTSVLTADAATLAATGNVAVNITGTSTLTARAAILAATGSALLAITGDSVLTASAATLAATGGETFSGTSALTGQAAILAADGSALLAITGTSALTARPATLDSSGSSLLAITGAAAVTGAAATLAAVGSESFLGTSGLTAQPGELAASGTALLAITGDGALTARAATLAGVGVETFSGTSALTGAAATLGASGSVSNDVTGDAGLVAGAALLASSGTVMGGGTVVIVGVGGTVRQKPRKAKRTEEPKPRAITGIARLEAQPARIVAAGLVRYPLPINDVDHWRGEPRASTVPYGTEGISGALVSLATTVPFSRVDTPPPAITPYSSIPPLILFENEEEELLLLLTQ